MMVKEPKELIFVNKLHLQLLVNDSYFKRTVTSVTSEEEKDLLSLVMELIREYVMVIMLKKIL